MTRQTLSALKMVAITDAVHIPFIAKLVAEGKFKATADHEKAAGAMLDELLRWTEALASLRTPR